MKYSLHPPSPWVTVLHPRTTCQPHMGRTPAGRSATSPGSAGRSCHPGQASPCFFFQAEDGIRDIGVTGVQTCALPIFFQRTLCEYQSFRAKDGGFIRREFFGKYPETLELVSDMSDEDIWRLQRGGHDSQKVYNAYKQAVEHKGRPTVILAKTIKGYGIASAESRNPTHQEKKLTDQALAAFKERFEIPIPAKEAKDGTPYRPATDSLEIPYMQVRMKQLDGYVPWRENHRLDFEAPPLEFSSESLAGSKGRALSTTQGYVSMVRNLMKHPRIGKLTVPTVPDEGRP